MITSQDIAFLTLTVAFAILFAIGAACMYAVLLGAKVWQYMDRGYGLGDSLRMAKGELK